MTTIGNVDVKLGLDSKEFNKNIKNAEKELNRFDGSINNSSNAVKMLQGTLGKLATAGAIIAIGKQIIDYSAKSVQAFREQDRAIKGLNNSLQNAGVYTVEYANHLQKLSAEIQSFSNYGDEAIEKAIGIGQAFSGNIKLTDDLIKATVDYAAATETDLQTAFTLVGKSIGTSTNALARYGVSLDQSMTKEEKMAAITQTLQQRFSGSAKAMADSSVRLKNATGDLSEEFGKALNPAVEKTQNVLIEGAKALTEWIRRVRILKSEMSELTLDELNDRLKEVSEYKAQLASGTFDRSGVSADANTKGAYGDLYRKYAKEQQDIIAQINKLREKEKQLAEESKNNYIAASAATTNAVISDSNKRSEAVKKEVDEFQKIKDMISSYRDSVGSAEISNNYLNTGTSILSGLSSQYKAKLDLEIWYQDERRKIIEESNGNIQLQEEAFGQLDMLKNAKLAQANLTTWEQFGSSLSNILSSSFSSVLSGQEKFGDALKNMMSGLLSQMLQMLIQYVIKELAIRAVSMFLGGPAGAAVGIATSLSPTIQSHHSGGMIPGTKEQLAVLQGGERVLNRSEAANYNSDSGKADGGINNVMVFNIKAWDGKDVIDTLKSNSQTINQIVSSGIKNNNQGLRTVVQNT